jgi:hypothetical protein
MTNFLSFNIESDKVNRVFEEYNVVSSYPNPQIIINEAPSHADNFVKVKKILNQ